MHKKEERGGDERRVDSAVNISLTFSFWFPVREHQMFIYARCRGEGGNLKSQTNRIFPWLDTIKVFDLNSFCDTHLC